MRDPVHRNRLARHEPYPARQDDAPALDLEAIIHAERWVIAGDVDEAEALDPFRQWMVDINTAAPAYGDEELAVATAADDDGVHWMRDDGDGDGFHVMEEEEIAAPVAGDGDSGALFHHIGVWPRPEWMQVEQELVERAVDEAAPVVVAPGLHDADTIDLTLDSDDDDPRAVAAEVEPEVELHGDDESGSSDLDDLVSNAGDAGYLKDGFDDFHDDDLDSEAEDSMFVPRPGTRPRVKYEFVSKVTELDGVTDPKEVTADPGLYHAVACATFVVIATVLGGDVTAHAHDSIVAKEGFTDDEGGIRGRLRRVRNSNYRLVAAAGRQNYEERLAVEFVITGFRAATKKIKADATMKTVMERFNMSLCGLQELYVYPAYRKAFVAAMWRLINIKINKQEVEILMADLASLQAQAGAVRSKIEPLKNKKDKMKNKLRRRDLAPAKRRAIQGKIDETSDALTPLVKELIPVEDEIKEVIWAIIQVKREIASDQRKARRLLQEARDDARAWRMTQRK